MPRFDDGDVTVEAALEAIDATLAGDPVDPVHAELAELALLLAGERPRAETRFALALDQAVERRFAGPRPGPLPKPAAGRRRWWVWTPAAGLAAALVTAVVIVVVGAGRTPTSSGGGTFAAASSAPHRTSKNAPASSAAATSPPGTVTFPPPTGGRQTIQAGQLALSTNPSRIDQVAQELFVVVGQVRGIVENSTITATSGSDGYAQFQLSIPSSALPQAMASLSELRYAKVSSRTDTSQDVTDRYQADVRALADARALRSSLLRQLAGATTQAQIDSLTARIHDAEASISSDQATLASLTRQVDYSQVSVTINGGGGPVPVPSTGTSAFGLGQAAHDAGRVLTVAAGIVLIGAAALVPVALLGGLVWWVVAVVRRRRREQILDLA